MSGKDGAAKKTCLKNISFVWSFRVPWVQYRFSTWPKLEAQINCCRVYHVLGINKCYNIRMNKIYENDFPPFCHHLLCVKGWQPRQSPWCLCRMMWTRPKRKFRQGSVQTEVPRGTWGYKSLPMTAWLLPLGPSWQRKPGLVATVIFSFFRQFITAI